MPRTIRDANLGTREARLRLRARSKPYFRTVEPKQLALGYRRLAGQSGTWCVRRYIGNQRYVVDGLGAVADDHSDADGKTVLTFAQAQRRALERKPKPDGPYTVRQAVAAYLEFLQHHRKTARDAELRCNAFIL